MFSFNIFGIYLTIVFLSAWIVVDGTQFKVSGRIFCTTNEPNFPETTSSNGTDSEEGSSDDAIEIPPPLKGVKLQLWEEDRFDPNDLLAETISDKKGQFQLEGEESEIGQEEPFLLILHKCHKQNELPIKQPGCHYRTRMDLSGMFPREGPAEIADMKIWLGSEIALVGDEFVKLKTESVCE